MGAEVAAGVNVVATAAVMASVKPRRAPRVAPRVATVRRVAAVTREASAAVAVSAVRPAPWWS